jgi:hypothetical protein
MYLVISQCRIPIDFTFWPTYELLHVLHFNLYMPLEFILFIGILSRSWLRMVLLVRKAMFKLVVFDKSHPQKHNKRKKLSHLQISQSSYTQGFQFILKKYALRISNLERELSCNYFNNSPEVFKI